MITPKYKKNINTLFLNRVNINEDTNILDNLPNDLEYLYIGNLIITYTNKINNLPITLKNIYVDFVYYEGFINEKYIVCGTTDLKKNGLLYKIIKLPYDCNISFLKNFNNFEIIEKDKNKIQFLYFKWCDLENVILKITNKKINITIEDNKTYLNVSYKKYE